MEIYDIIKRPIITEKSTAQQDKNIYVIEVSKYSNKPQIKKALKKMYQVDVVSVRIVNVPGKIRRRRKIKGYLSGYKKAIVELKKGQKIEGFETAGK